MEKKARKLSGKGAALPDFRFDFFAAARKAVKDHPEIKRDTIFVDAANDLYMAPARLLALLDEDDEARDALEKTVRHARRRKTSFSDTLPVSEKRALKSVVFHRDRHPLYDPQNREIDDAGTFDHETGHVLSPETDGTLAENTADAYAVIRHIQRFPGEKTSVSYAGWKRAVQFILAGQTSHLTTFTVDRILIDRETAGFLSLPPHVTAAIAKDYARQNTRDEEKLGKLARAFRCARDKKLTENTFLRIAAVTLKAPAESDTFYLGARVLLEPLGKGSKVIYDGRTVSLKDAKWERIKTALAGKISTLPAAHPLRAVPAL
jgi:hypothetical protein